MAKSGIYFITNVVNSKTYIGSSVNIKNRWCSHRYELNRNNHRNSHLQAAWIKYGSESFKFEIAEEVPKDQLVAVEQNYLDIVKLMPTCYYNMAYDAAAPGRGAKRSEEAKLEISKRMKGRIFSPEHRLRISLAAKGRPFSPEHRLKLSKAGENRKMSDKNRQRMIGNKYALGLVFSPEALKKISDAGKRCSPETIKKRTETRRKNIEAKHLIELGLGLPDTKITKIQVAVNDQNTYNISNDVVVDNNNH